MYGYASHNQRRLTCDLIRDLFNFDKDTSWLIFGDFNMVLDCNGKNWWSTCSDNPIINLHNNTIRDRKLEHI
jgi:hypothetical protein